MLTVELGGGKTYVVNKQAPTAQLWVSSPVSGPARFNWRGDHGWIDERDGEALTARFTRELSDAAGEAVAFDDANDVPVEE